MTELVRSLVSNDRVRYKDENVNLDLSYITDKLLAMAFPATGFDKLWRNSIEAVCDLLTSKHGHAFMVWNLSEIKYDSEKFNNQIVHMPFADHHPPPLLKYLNLIQIIDSWLNAESHNVACVHCVGGKGRTGTVIVGVMFYNVNFDTMDECVDHFAMKRSHLKKGVEQPSQLRWAKYFERFMNFEAVNRLPVDLKKLVISGFPKGTKYLMEIWSSPFEGVKLLSLPFDCKSPVLVIDINILLRNDIHIVFYQKKSVPVPADVKLFHVCLHTYFIKEKHFVFTREDIDHVEKNFQKSLTDEFKVAFTFTPKDDVKELIDVPEWIYKMVEKFHERRRNQASKSDLVLSQSAKLAPPLPVRRVDRNSRSNENLPETVAFQLPPLPPRYQQTLNAPPSPTSNPSNSVSTPINNNATPNLASSTSPTTITINASSDSPSTSISNSNELPNGPGRSPVSRSLSSPYSQDVRRRPLPPKPLPATPQSSSNSTATPLSPTPPIPLSFTAPPTPASPAPVPALSPPPSITESTPSRPSRSKSRSTSIVPHLIQKKLNPNTKVDKVEPTEPPENAGMKQFDKELKSVLNARSLKSTNPNHPNPLQN